MRHDNTYFQSGLDGASALYIHTDFCSPGLLEFLDDLGMMKRYQVHMYLAFFTVVTFGYQALALRRVAAPSFRGLLGFIIALVHYIPTLPYFYGTCDHSP